MTYQEAVLATSPSAVLILADAVGAKTVTDLTGGPAWSVATGPVFGEPSFMGGDLSTAVKLGSGRIEAPAGKFAFAGTQSFTLLAWLNPELLDNSDRRIFSREFPTSGTVTDGYALMARSGKFFLKRIVGGVEKSQSTPAGMAPGEPHMVVWTFDGARSRFYLDGSKLLDVAHAGSLASPEAKLTIGAKSGGNLLFKGLAKDVAVWEGKALTDSQIDDLYQSGMAGRAPKAKILGGNRRPGIWVGRRNVNNQVFRSKEAALALIKVFEREGPLARIMLPFNCENTNFQPPTGPTRTDYGRGDGGIIRVRVCPVKADGTPDLKTVFASETVAIEQRYKETQELLGLQAFPLSGVEALNIQCVFFDPRDEEGNPYIRPADVPVAFVVDCLTPEPLKNWVSYNSTTCERALAINSPHNRPCMDKNAPGAVAGLDPRERVVWTQEKESGDPEWFYGPDVGKGSLQYEFTGDDLDAETERGRKGWMRLPWMAWQEDSSTTIFHQDTPYQSYFQDGTYTLTCNGVPRSCTLTHAGGLGNGEEDVGSVKVENLATGEVAETEHLGPGLQIGELDTPISVTADDLLGDNIRISCTGTVAKHENDEPFKRLAGLGATREWPFKTTGLQNNGKESDATDFAQLFVLDEDGQWPFYASQEPAPGGSYGDRLYGSGTYGAPAPPRIALGREYPPDDLACIITPPQGARSRWAADEPLTENVIAGLRLVDEMPGGDKEGSGDLARDPRTSWPDLGPFSDILVHGPGGEEVANYRLDKTPESDGDHMAITSEAVGWSKALEDDNALIGPGFIDGDLSKVGDPSSQRKADLLGPGDLAFVANPSVAAAGSGEAGASVLLDFSGAQSLPGKKALGYGVYDSGGPGIGQILYQLSVLSGSEGLPAWTTVVQSALDDRFLEGLALGTDHNATDATGSLEAVAGSRFAAIVSEYIESGESPVDMTDLHGWLVKIIGDHGLPLQGTWPNVGFTVSQMLGWAIPRFTCLEARPEDLEDLGYIIGQAWFSDPGPMSQVVQELTKYELLDWFVFGGKRFQLKQPGTYGRKWQAYAGPSGLQEQGFDAARSWKEITVLGQDVDGSTLTVGAIGSGADIEDARLEITDPDHPAVRAAEAYGPNFVRRDRLDLRGISTPARMIEVGEIWLREANRLNRSGSATISDYAMDDRGVMRPVSRIRAGDEVRFPDAADPSYRRIVRRTYEHTTRTATVDLDAPPEGLQALLERLQADIQTLALS